MSAPHIILDCLPSLSQKLSDLVEFDIVITKNNFACFLLRHGVNLSTSLSTNSNWLIKFVPYLTLPLGWMAPVGRPIVHPR